MWPRFARAFRGMTLLLLVGAHAGCRASGTPGAPRSGTPRMQPFLLVGQSNMAVLIVPTMLAPAASTVWVAGGGAAFPTSWPCW